MKILAISLKNLASLAGPIDIDFTAEPLASAGLFAITGPTGAGKSTLLDALCLALFGSVPRLGNLKRETKVPDIDSEIGSDDPRTLLRRGAGNGYAQVDFVGIDGRHYRARWETNRARDKANGKLQSSKQSLYDLQTQQVLTSQKREFEQLVEARLGLNFDQFTRAVMLAQSEFSAFLKADDKDRSELLEKLTNTAIYSQLGRRAFSKAREAQEAHRQLESEAVGVRPMSDEDRALLDRQFADAGEQLQYHQGLLKQLEQRRQWLAEDQRLRARMSEALDQQREAREHAAGLADARHLLQRLDQLAPHRHLFAQHDGLLAQLTPLAAQLSAMAARQVALSSEHGHCKRTTEQAREAFSQAQAAQQSSAPLLQEAFSAERDFERLQREAETLRTQLATSGTRVTEGEQALQELAARQQTSQATLARLEQELAQSTELAPLAEAWNAWRDRLQGYLLIHNRLTQGNAELAQLQQRADAAAAVLGAQRQTLEVLYREADTEPDAVAEQVQILAGLLQDNRQQQRSQEALARQWKSLQQLEERLATVQQEQARLHQQREQLTAEGLQARDALQLAEQTLGVTRALLERQRLARSESVETLRQHLEDHQPCPVCGSVEHPWHQPEALLKDLQLHDQREADTAQQAVDALKERVIALRERVATLITQQKALRQQHDELQQEHAGVLPILHEHAQGPALLAQVSGAREAWLTKQLAHLDQRITQDEARQAALLRLQQEAAKLQQQLRDATQASETSSRQLAEQRAQLSTDQRRLQEERQAFAALLPEPWMAALEHDPAAAFLQLDRQVGDRLARTQQRFDEHQEQLERQQRIERQQIAQQAATEQHGALRERLDQQAAQFTVVQAQLQRLLGEHPSAQAWQLHHQQATEQARQVQDSAEQRLQEIDRELLQLATELNGGEQRRQALTVESASIAEQIARWRKGHPELTDDALPHLLAYDEPQLQALRQQLLGADKALEQAQVLIVEREQQLQAHRQVGPAARETEPGAPDSVDLDTAQRELQTQVAACEQQCAELRAQQVADQRRQVANQALAQRLQLAYAEYQRWGRISALVGSASGDTFRKIAQAYNLDLLVHHANVQLRQLVRRYRLKRGGSMLGLLVMDTEMGDELRSVHSLSGGETFLVSLALALGLASMASSTLKIESLFIDEGFGSLDPESLQLAMDALDGLQAQGRKVGVISHVQEMHERIPVQIRVQRQGNGLSTVEVG